MLIDFTNFMAIKQSSIDWFLDDTFWLYSLANANKQAKTEKEKKVWQLSYQLWNVKFPVSYVCVHD